MCGYIRYHLAALLTLLLVAACDHGAHAANPLTIAQDIREITSLDPGECANATCREIIANLYDRILWRDPADINKLVGGVAESWR